MLVRVLMVVRNAEKKRHEKNAIKSPIPWEALKEKVPPTRIIEPITARTMATPRGTLKRSWKKTHDARATNMGVKLLKSIALTTLVWTIDQCQKMRSRAKNAPASQIK